MAILTDIRNNYCNWFNRIETLNWAYNVMIEKLKQEKLYCGDLDKMVILFVLNAWKVSSLDDKEWILRWIHLYDQFDPLNRFDTAWELFMELWIVTMEEVDNY